MSRVSDVRVKYASDCLPCSGCGEPWCVEHEEHYADCPCPGPHSECDVCENPVYDCLCDDGPSYQGRQVVLEKPEPGKEGSV